MGRRPTTRQIASLVVAGGALAGCATGTGASPGCTPGATEAVAYAPSYPVYGSVAALVDTAELVVEATVASSTVGSVGGTVETVYAVRVEEVLKGDATTGGTIEVAELGGIFECVRHTTTYGVELDEGATYLLFLTTAGDGPMRLVNPVEGTFPVVNGMPTVVEGSTLEPMSALADLAHLRGGEAEAMQ